MISADSTGDILVWRCDVKGWYQLLRKLKRDTSIPMPPSTGKSNGLAGGGMSGVLSLTMHPDKAKGQMLALCKHPAQLKMYNMSTYKPLSHCAGYVGMSTATAGGGAFSRATLSADGRYAICGSSLSAHSSQYRLQVWDSQTGHAVKTSLSGTAQPAEVLLHLRTKMIYDTNNCRLPISVPDSLGQLASQAAHVRGRYGGQ